MDCRIAHLSDLHFGCEDPSVVQGLQLDLQEHNPALIVVSGDLTQRARAVEFSAAKRFLTALPFPKLVVPGNHDVPLLHLWERFLFPFRRYSTHFDTHFNPFAQVQRFAIVGINTVVPHRWKSGRISAGEFGRVSELLKAVPSDHIPILVMHHPLAEELSRPENLKWFKDLNIRIILSGHSHLERSDALISGGKSGQPIIWIQAGTAVSLRKRGEVNSYNLIATEGSRLTVDARAWDGARFQLKIRRTFELNVFIQ